MSEDSGRKDISSFTAIFYFEEPAARVDKSRKRLTTRNEGDIRHPLNFTNVSAGIRSMGDYEIVR